MDLSINSINLQSFSQTLKIAERDAKTFAGYTWNMLSVVSDQITEKVNSLFDFSLDADFSDLWTIETETHGTEETPTAEEAIFPGAGLEDGEFVETFVRIQEEQHRFLGAGLADAEFLTEFGFRAPAAEKQRRVAPKKLTTSTETKTLCPEIKINLNQQFYTEEAPETRKTRSIAQHAMSSSTVKTTFFPHTTRI